MPQSADRLSPQIVSFHMFTLSDRVNSFYVNNNKWLAPNPQATVGQW